MKKKLRLFLIILLTFSLTACGINMGQTDSSDSLSSKEGIIQSENENQPKQSTDEQNLKESGFIAAEEGDDNHMKLSIGDYVFTATLADNSSADALKKMLQEGPATIDMKDYANMEKVGLLGTNLPRNDEQITTESGDLILYQGNAFVIYYAPNSWNFTRIGKIDNVTQEELKEALGNGDVKVTLSLD